VTRSIAAKPSVYPQKALYLMLLGAAGIPLSLIWDYSWECTIGVDLFWGPPHTATYISVALAGLGALSLIVKREPGIRIGFLSGPVGAWITAWGAVAFVASVLFDRWWQGAYGLGAGIWHPPQICKAVSFFAILAGTWAYCAIAQNRQQGRFKNGARTALSACSRNRPNIHADKAVRAPFFALLESPLAQRYGYVFATSLLLALINVVSVTGSYANRQHSGWFYEVACASYSLVLVAAAVSAQVRFPATMASVIYMGLWCGMVWLLPLFAAKPLTAPVYNSLDHMMPPPFPLLLVAPAIAVDLLLSYRSWPRGWVASWLKAGITGMVFGGIFVLIQWFFSEFLLSDAAKNWIFAGGGEHWPFFLKIPAQARQVFWSSAGDELNESSFLLTLFLAAASARLGLWVGQWLKGLRR